MTLCHRTPRLGCSSDADVRGVSVPSMQAREVRTSARTSAAEGSIRYRRRLISATRPSHTAVTSVTTRGNARHTVITPVTTKSRAHQDKRGV